MTISKSDTAIIYLYDQSAKSLEDQLIDGYSSIQSDYLIIRIADNERWRVLPHNTHLFPSGVPNYTCSLKKLPAGLGKLSQLTYLDISDLGLTELSTEINSLLNLKELNISLNQVSYEEIAHAISRLSQLESIYLYWCGLSKGTIFKLRNDFPNISFYDELDDYLDQRKKSFLPPPREHIKKANQNLLQLFDAVYSYYPIGSPSFNNKYPGFYDLKEIRKNKFQSELWDQWESFVDTFKRSNNDLKIFNRSHADDLKYSAFISLETENYADLADKTIMLVELSIVGNCYTIYFIKGIKPKETVSIHNGLMLKLFQNVYYGSKCAAANEMKLFNEAKAIMSTSFPNCTFQTHNSLMGRTLKGGRPLDLNDEDFLKPEYSFYNFLFEPSFNSESMKIAE